MDAQDAKSDFQEQGPKKGIVIIIITILLGTNGLLLWQFFDKKNNLDVANQTIVARTAEKDALQMQLNQFKYEFEKVKSENVSLQSQLSEKDDQIKAKVNEIQKLILAGGPAQIAKAKAELARLKEMNTTFIAQIDSLNQVNAILQAENQNLSTNLTAEKSRSENLAKENSRLNSKVTAGSILKAMNIITESLRYKSNGKEVVTNKSKQVQKIRTKFMLTENRVIDRGQVEIILRVIGPDGQVESSSEKPTFKSNGQDLLYTASQMVEYSNDDTPVEVMWAKGTNFVKGKYNVEIYHNGVVIGKSEIELK